MNVIAILLNSFILKKMVQADGDILVKLHITAPPTVVQGWLCIKWLAPHSHYFKLNADGSYKGNPSISGGGCIFRYDNRQVVCVQADFYGVTTNNVAKARGLL